MTDRRDPQPGEIWERKGKRRVVVKVRFNCVAWRADGPNHGQNEGTMFLAGWHRRGWKLVEEAPHE